MSRAYRRGRRRPRRDKACVKAAFPTEELALARIAEIRREPPGSHGPVPVRAYQCQHCGWYHVTSKEHVGREVIPIPPEGPLPGLGGPRTAAGPTRGV